VVLLFEAEDLSIKETTHLDPDNLSSRDPVFTEWPFDRFSLPESSSRRVKQDDCVTADQGTLFATSEP
jgi:hypothetical protein